MKARSVLGRNNFIAIHKITLQVLKDVRFPHATALLLEELLSMHAAFNAEWVYRPREVWERDFLLTEWNIRCAIDDLKGLGILLTKRKIAVVGEKSGTYTHFQIQEGRLEELIEAAENAVQHTSESHSTATSESHSTATSESHSTVYKEEQEKNKRRTIKDLSGQTPPAQPLLLQDESQKPNEEKVMSRKQHHAISASMDKSARKKLEEMLCEAYPYARTLINKHGYKAETLYSRLASSPSLLDNFIALPETCRFEPLLTIAIQEAGKHDGGWESQVGPQFLNLLSKERKSVPSYSSGNTSVSQSSLVNQSKEADDYAAKIDHAIRTSRGNLEGGALAYVMKYVSKLMEINPSHPKLSEVQRAYPSEYRQAELSPGRQAQAGGTAPSNEPPCGEGDKPKGSVGTQETDGPQD